MGHARSMIFMDAFIRYLTFREYTVNYIRNITDIDDKIIEKAGGKDIFEFTSKIIDQMHDDFHQLHLMRPSQEPKATEYIEEINSMIAQLVKHEHAYKTDDGLYFSVDSIPQYYILRQQDQKKLLIKDNLVKRNPADFAIWKSAKLDEPFWDSLYGPGRPGWHIECSAIANKVLGKMFDIHAGGADLVFPHHENEIAQSFAYNGCIPAKHWMHIGLLQVNKTKMSKSLNNFHYISDVLKKYHGDVIRMFILSSHYASDCEFSEQELQEAKKSLEKIYVILAKYSDEENEQVDLTDFITCLEYDFNTPQALSIIFKLIRDVEKTKNINHIQKIRTMMKILGFTCQPAEYFLAKSDCIFNAEEINLIIAARDLMKIHKDFKSADAMRDLLKKQGIFIEDHIGKTVWRTK